MSWQDKMLGFLGKEGFQVPIEITSFMGECLLLTDNDLDEIELVQVDYPTE